MQKAESIVQNNALASSQETGNDPKELAELPSIFAIPQSFRASLPYNAQIWLGTIEARIDGMHLDVIYEEAEEIAGETGDHEKLYRIARRLFFRRVEQIMRIMDPNIDLELGMDLPIGLIGGETPGGAADRILDEYEESQESERRGKEYRKQERRRAIEKLVRQKLPGFKLAEDFEIPQSGTYPDIAEDILAEMAAKKAAAV
jgi:hypothetical protein